MKLELYKNPKVQKWSLFAALVLSLGFNLSWNPQSAQIARNEMQSLDLAQMAGVDPKSDPNLRLNQPVSLAKVTGDDLWEKMTIQILQVKDGKKVYYNIKSPDQTECKVCGLSTHMSEDPVNPNNLDSMKALILEIAMEKAKVAKEDAAKRSKDKSQKTGKDEKTADTSKKKSPQDIAKEIQATCEAESDFAECVLEKIPDCREDEGKQLAACKREFDAAYSVFEKMMLRCLDQQSPASTPIIVMRTSSGSNCQQIQQMALEVLEISPNDTAIKNISQFMKVSAIKHYNSLRKVYPQGFPLTQLSEVSGSYRQSIFSHIRQNSFVENATEFANSFYNNINGLGSRLSTLSSTNFVLPLNSIDTDIQAVRPRGTTDPTKRSASTSRGGSLTPPPALGK